MRTTAWLTAEHDTLINPARRPPHPFSNGFAMSVCVERFRPMVKTYVLCPDVTPMFLDPNVSNHSGCNTLFRS
jgi:hypothetical protein